MKFLKGFLTLLGVCLCILAFLLPVAVFVHEATHCLLYTLEGVPVTSFHVLDALSLQKGYLGFVTTTKESSHGSAFNEGIASISGYLCVALILLATLVIPLRAFTIHQLRAMGLKRNTPPERSTMVTTLE